MDFTTSSHRIETAGGHLFALLYSEDFEQIREWAPLVINGRDRNQKVAATRMETGTGVNFGNLTRTMVKNLTEKQGMALHLRHEVQDIERGVDGLGLNAVKLDEPAAVQK